MIYISLGSQPVVASVLKDCSLNTNDTLLDNVGEYSYESLLSDLNSQFGNFFPPESQIKIYGGTINIVNGTPYTIVKDKRNGTLFYDVCQLEKN